MTSQATCCPDAKQQYINGLGIVRHIAFLDDDSKAAHPEMLV